MPNEAYQSFLVEIGVEEIPSRYVTGIAEGLLTALAGRLSDARLPYVDLKPAWTPRRLIVQAEVAPGQTAEIDEVRGPAVAVAYRDGEPTPALQGFLRRVGLSADELSEAEMGGKTYLIARVQKPVQRAEAVLPQLVAGALESLPLPRSMRWGGGDERFIRPVRWLVMLYGNTLLAGSVLGVKSGDATYGNRTDHPRPLRVTSVPDYWAALTQGMVLADANARRQAILDGANRLADTMGGQVDWDDDLLTEVTNLVEWPTPFMGHFEEGFLAVPEPVLVTAMRVHQRYFPVRDQAGQLMPRFIAVRNGAGEALDQVRRGNEKVLRARLSDARYFFDLDQRQPLRDLEPALAGVTLHAKLGSYADKVSRLETLYHRTRSWWHLDGAEERAFHESVHLYKCDLLTHVVGEFPELQGEMGAIFAARDGESEAVVAAIRDQYRPGFPKDRLPMGRVAQILGILDRTDTLVSFYGADIRATGSEDPFGLRRVALGLARIAAETPALGDHSVRAVLHEAADVQDLASSVAEDVYGLVASRLVSEWEARWPAAWLQAALAREFPWERLAQRLEFLSAQQGTPALDAVMSGYKRVSRMSRQQEARDLAPVYEGIEGAIREQTDRIRALPDHALDAWWAEVQTLVPLIQTFFDEVLVMDPDPAIREARLGLLGHVEVALGRYFAWDRL